MVSLHLHLQCLEDVLIQKELIKIKCFTSIWKSILNTGLFGLGVKSAINLKLELAAIIIGNQIERKGADFIFLNKVHDQHGSANPSKSERGESLVSA